jgi:alpha-tubulin suppressor-like RCC1 family protein
MNRDGMTGLELTSGIQFVPTKVNEDGDWGSISAGKGFFSLATKLDGTMWSWGTNEDARTGLGITEGNTPTPTQVSVEDD